jgi:hypothetical protein
VPGKPYDQTSAALTCYTSGTAVSAVQGSWCQVDPAQCLGYYSMFRTEKGKLHFYDYCVPVRGG